MAADCHLGFSMPEYFVHQIQYCVKFFDPNNVSKDTKIISVADFLEELLKIS